MFFVGKEYTKKDIYGILGVPEKSQGGSWDTGYRSFRGDIYIFTNIGGPGRSGLNHGNYWQNDKLIWFGKQSSNFNQPLIKSMISNDTNVHVFFRDNSLSAYTYKGLGRAEAYDGDKPVRIVWSFVDPTMRPSEQANPIFGIDELYKHFKEGEKNKAEVNVYKRSEQARQDCLDIKGYTCSVCEFDFEECFGAIGAGFIHVHHINEMANAEGERIVNPATDLIPVCPNCHAMLHKRKPAYSIEELKVIRKDTP